MVVTIDDRTSRQFEHTLKLDVATGRHRIEVRTTGGRIVLSKVVDIDPFDVTRVRIDDRTPAALSYGDRDDRRDDHRDDDHDGRTYTATR